MPDTPKGSVSMPRRVSAKSDPWWGFHGLELFWRVQQMLVRIGMWGIWGPGLTHWDLYHVPTTILEKFLLCVGIHLKARTSSFSAEHCIIRRWSIVFISPDKGFTIVADQCMDTVYQCLLYICVYRFCQALAGAQSLSPAHNVIRMYSVCPPQCLISWLEVRAIVWKKGSMSVSSHVQAVVACGQPSFMNANKKRRSKKLSKHYWHLTIACLREPFHFSARYIKN